MNHKQILELTLQLSQALDQNYDVVDMEAVFSIITTLEGTAITKEQLEATRLAKYINQLRRRTKCEQLARKSKSLLKKWREMVGIQSINEVNIIEKSSLIYKNDSNMGASCLNSGNDTILTARFSEYRKDELDSHIAPSLEFTRNNLKSTKMKITSNLTGRNSPSSSTSAVKALIAQNKKKCEDLSNDLRHRQALHPQCQKQLSFTNLMSKLDVNATNMENFKLRNAYAECSDSKLSKTITMDHSSNSNSGVLQKDRCFTSNHDVRLQNANFDEKYGTINNNVSDSKVFLSSLYREKSRKIYNTSCSDFLKNVQINDIILNNTSAVNINKSKHCTSDTTILLQSVTSLENLSESNTSINSLLADDSIKCKQEVLPSHQNFQENIQSLWPSQHQTSNTNMIEKDLTFTGKVYQGADAHENIEKDLVNRIKNTESVEVIYLPHESQKLQMQCKFDDGLLDFEKINNISYRKLVSSDKIEANYENSGRSVKNNNEMLIDNSNFPKKRGRRRGSRGVNTAFKKQVSLSAEMLVTPFNNIKKVKTTKELYADIKYHGINLPVKQDNEICATTSTCVNFHENKSHNPEMSAEVLFSGDKNCECIPELQAEIQDYPITNKIEQSNFNLISENIKDDMNVNIKEDLISLLNELPPVPIIKEIEEKCSTGIIPCTCTVVAIQSQQFNRNQDREAINNKLVFKDRCTDKSIDFLDYQHNLESDMESSTFIPVQSVKRIKSIFDLDFEDNADYVKECSSNTSHIIAKDNQKNEYNVNHNNITTFREPFAIKDTEYLPDISVNLYSGHNTNQFNGSDGNLFSVFQIQIDPKCQAQYRFEVLTQKITKFHVNALHNYFIPNINGNWNAEVNKCDEKNDLLQFDENLYGNNVVPHYGSLMNKCFIKNFSSIEFKKYFKWNSKLSRTDQEITHIPFFGVARKINSNYKHTYKTILKKKIKCKKHASKTFSSSCRSRISTIINNTNQITNSKQELHSNNLGSINSFANQYKNNILHKKVSDVSQEMALISKKEIDEGKTSLLNAESKINVLNRYNIYKLKSYAKISKRIDYFNSRKQRKRQVGNKNLYIKKYVKQLFCRNGYKHKSSRNKERNIHQRNATFVKTRNSNTSWYVDTSRRDIFPKICDYDLAIHDECNVANRSYDGKIIREIDDKNKKGIVAMNEESTTCKSRNYSGSSVIIKQYNNMLFKQTNKHVAFPSGEQCLDQYIDQKHKLHNEIFFHVEHLSSGSNDRRDSNRNENCDRHSIEILSDDASIKNKSSLQSFNNMYEYPTRRYQMVENKMYHENTLIDGTLKNKINSSNYKDKFGDSKGDEVIGRIGVTINDKHNLQGDLSIYLQNSDKLEKNFPHNVTNGMTLLGKKHFLGESWQKSDNMKYSKNNYEHIQKFKEWHEVLHLHTYNNEMLTALPYVILE